MSHKEYHNNIKQTNEMLQPGMSDFYIPGTAYHLVKNQHKQNWAIWKIILFKFALENNFLPIQIERKVPSMHYQFKDNFKRTLNKINKI